MGCTGVAPYGICCAPKWAWCGADTLLCWFDIEMDDDEDELVVEVVVFVGKFVGDIFLLPP